jgi:hypothetical protein
MSIAQTTMQAQFKFTTLTYFAHPMLIKKAELCAETMEEHVHMAVETDQIWHRPMFDLKIRIHSQKIDANLYETTS